MRLPQVGETIAARYVLDEAIGEGGFARVFRATDRQAGRTVAVKVLKPKDGGYPASIVSRFHREAQVLSRLTDPHTLRLFDTGRTDEGVLFIVSELVGGADLSDVIAEHGPLPEPIAVSLLFQLLQSLREAHAAGLLHRDIKSDNVRVFEADGDRWRVKVMDFGIAKDSGADAAAITRTGEIVGTLVYMSPEQMRGEEITPASDIFSVGLVLCEMLSGEVLPVRRALAASQPLPIPASPRLLTIIARMLETEPGDRFQTIDELLYALSVPVQQPPPQPAQVFENPQPRHRPPAPNESTRSAVPFLLVALLAVIAAVTAFALRSKDDPPPPPVTRTPLSQVLAARPQVDEPQPPAKPAEKLPDAEETAPETGCGRTPTISVGKPVSESGGDWVTYLPRGYDDRQQHPLVLFFHTDGHTTAGGLKATTLRAVADVNQFVIIVPRGGDLLAWPNGMDPDDAFDIVTAARERYCLGENVYVVGHGTGGAVASALSCEPWVSAIATTSYRAPTTRNDCNRRVPYAHFAPLQSKHLPPDGGPGCMGANFVISLADHEKMWRDRNGCSDESNTQTLNDGRCTSWTCETAFVSCHTDGGHQWPGAKPRRTDALFGCDGKPSNFPYGEMIWKFFSTAN